MFYEPLMYSLVCKARIQLQQAPPSGSLLHSPSMSSTRYPLLPCHTLGFRFFPAKDYCHGSGSQHDLNTECSIQHNRYCQSKFRRQQACHIAHTVCHTACFRKSQFFQSLEFLSSSSFKTFWKENCTKEKAAVRLSKGLADLVVGNSLADVHSITGYYCYYYYHFYYCFYFFNYVLLLQPLLLLLLLLCC